MSYNEERGDSELDAIVSLLAELPLQPKKVMAMYYHENMRLIEIATYFGIAESEVYQIHAQTIASIRQSAVKGTRKAPGFGAIKVNSKSVSFFAEHLQRDIEASEMPKRGGSYHNSRF